MLSVNLIGRTDEPVPVLNLQKFDMNFLKFDSSNLQRRCGPAIFILGSREKGKTFLIKDILHYNQDVPCGTVVTAADSNLDVYNKIIPKQCIHKKYNSSIITNVLSRQSTIIEKNQATDQDQVQDPRAFLILDDCMYDAFHGEPVKDMYINSRRSYLMTICAVQFPLTTSPNVRANMDFIFIFKEPIITTKRHIYEDYAGIFPTFESFCQVLDACTQNHGCLVIDNVSKSDKIEDRVFWYKADSHEHFMLCS